MLHAGGFAGGIVGVRELFFGVFVEIGRIPVPEFVDLWLGGLGASPSRRGPISVERVFAAFRALGISISGFRLAPFL